MSQVSGGPQEAHGRVPLDPVDLALALARGGFGIVPVYAPNAGGPGCTCNKKTACPSPGKHPIGADWEKRLTRSAGTIRERLARSGGQYGVVPWAGERGLILDIDKQGEWPEGLELPKTFWVRTTPKSDAHPLGKAHVYLRLPEEYDSTRLPATAAWGEVRVEGASRHVVGPGSRHAGGWAYEPHGTPDEIATISLDALGALFPGATPRAPDERRGRYSVPERWPGSWHDALVPHLGSLRSRNPDLAREEAWAIVLDTWPSRLTDWDARSDFGSGDRCTSSERHLRHRFDAIWGSDDRNRKAKRLREDTRQRQREEDRPTPGLRQLSTYEVEPIDWLWYGWLPRGVVVLCDGDPGDGKSTIVFDLTARLTKGEMWPGGEPVGMPGRALFLTPEDPAGRVIRPRIELAGGDPDKITLVTDVTLTIPTDLPWLREVLERAHEQADPYSLVFIDPLTSHIGDSRTISDTAMRSAFDPLHKLAEDTDVSIVINRHFSKDRTATAISRGAGSLGGIMGAARVAWAVVRDGSDPEGRRRVLGVTKSNWAEFPSPRQFRLSSKVHPALIHLPGKHETSTVEWLGESSLTVSDILAMTEPEKEVTARDVLRGLLDANGGAVSSAELEKAMHAHGIRSKASIDRARKALKARSKKRDMKRGWWTLADGVILPEEAAPGMQGTIWKEPPPVDEAGSESEVPPGTFEGSPIADDEIHSADPEPSKTPPGTFEDSPRNLRSPQDTGSPEGSSVGARNLRLAAGASSVPSPTPDGPEIITEDARRRLMGYAMDQDRGLSEGELVKHLMDVRATRTAEGVRAALVDAASAGTIRRRTNGLGTQYWATDRT